MATLNWPGFGITSISPRLDQPSQSNANQWTGTRTVISDPWHGKWSFKVSLATMQGDAAFQAARAFFTNLKGQINTFHLPAVEAPQNANTGVTLSANAAQGATSIALTGLTTALVAGNMVTLNGQLLSLTSVGSLSGSAQTVNFMPTLRAAATSTTAVQTAKPYALVFLSTSDFSWDIGSWRRYGLSFDCQEAVAETDGADPALDNWTGGIGSGGGGGTSFSFPQLTSFISRSVLAAVVSPTDKQVAYLTEAGREGVFVFSAANLSAKVTADTAQGIYVAPAADTSGASGAWVRPLSAPVISLNFGPVTSSSVSNAIASLAASALGGVGYGSGIGPLRIPASSAVNSMGATPIELNYTMRISGDGVGYAGGWSTALKWSAGSHGYRVQYYNTTGDTAIGGGLPGGTASVIERQALQGSYTTTEGEYHGIFARGNLSARDLNIWDFQGDGIHIHADSGQPEGGNANGWEVTRLFSQGCRIGLSVDGHDANQGVASNVVVSGARQWGIYDNAGAQNLYIAPLTQLCGWSNNDGTAGKPVSTVSQGGQRYSVIAGQEAGASTNAPNGLSGIGTGDNTWWYWYSAGGVDAFNVAWFSGIALRAGGPYRMTGATLLHPYAEAGQPPNQFGGDVLRIGGTLANRSVGGAHIYANSNQIHVNDLNVYAGGISYNDDQSGTLNIGRYAPGLPYSIIIPSAVATALILRAPDNSNGVEVSNAAVTIDKPLTLASFAKASLPSAATAGQMIFVTNDVGGSTPAFSDGTNWRRVADRAVIA